MQQVVCCNVRRARVREEMECEGTRSHCAQPAGAERRVRSARDETQTVNCEARYARGRPERAQQSSARVRNDREYGEVRR
jgi:hypothetical protein